MRPTPAPARCDSSCAKPGPRLGRRKVGGGGSSRSAVGRPSVGRRAVETQAEMGALLGLGASHGQPDIRGPVQSPGPRKQHQPGPAHLRPATQFNPLLRPRPPRNPTTLHAYRGLRKPTAPHRVTRHPEAKRRRLRACIPRPAPLRPSRRRRHLDVSARSAPKLQNEAPISDVSARSWGGYAPWLLSLWHVAKQAEGACGISPVQQPPPPRGCGSRNKAYHVARKASRGTGQ